MHKPKTNTKPTM